MKPDEVAEIVREEALSIVDAAEARLDPDDEWVALAIHDAGAFIEPLSSAELLARLRADDCDITAEALAAVDHPIRIAVHHGGQALIVGYEAPEDVPEAPAAHAWLERIEYGASLAERFPSLRGADGLRPWNVERLAEWALERDDPQANGAIALVVDVSSMRMAKSGGPLERLFAELPGGMAHHFREVFDEDHREAAARILAEAGRQVPAR